MFLLVLGTAFSTTGLVFLLTRSASDAIPFLVLGLLAFIPGSFHCVILYLAYTQQYGWTYDMIPTYDRQ